MGFHAGTRRVSQLSCLWTLPSWALNTRGARTGPSTFARASNSSHWRKRVKNPGPRTLADRRMQDSCPWQATKEGTGAPGHVPPSGLTSASAAQERARCACRCLLDTQACARVHASAGGPQLTLPRMSSLSVVGEAQRNQPLIPELFLLPTPGSLSSTM